MVELPLDDVGQGYDLAQTAQDPRPATLGRHTNDFITRFYARTPADFMVEYGWGGRTWTPPAGSPSNAPRPQPLGP